MPADLLFELAFGILAVAFLYSSVGHAGASGYIAVMSLCGMAPAEIKPAALALNVLVASIGAWQFWKAGYFSWRLFWPFALLSTPFAFIGGYIDLPTHFFKILVGAVLLYSALRFLTRPPPEEEPRQPARLAAYASGAAIGLLSGLTGTGGGIFLTPLLLFMHWARARQAAAVSALFILVNSMAGLLGNMGSTRQFPSFALPLAAAAMLGGYAGARLGSRRFSPAMIKRFLAFVLLIAGIKLIFA
jgi:uncharacterized membrane protein YfcA